MIGRFAPSPTGPLHLGSLRTALVAWLAARSAGSRFLVRIEDLDPLRSRREFEAEQLAALREIGIDWDGTPVRQSERGPRYAEALARLEAAGRLYPCFCTRAEIRAAASAPHGELPAGAYPGTCRALGERERHARIASGAPHSLRVDAGAAEVRWVDRLLGPRRGQVDDFVVRRADGVPAYQLAVILDDAAQGVQQVVRGVDLADSTPRQLQLARWLGLPEPAYVHVGLVLGPEGTRLAKRDLRLGARDGAPALETGAAATLTWLAHSLGLARGRARVRSADELLAEFDLDALPRGPVTLPGRTAATA